MVRRAPDKIFGQTGITRGGGGRGRSLSQFRVAKLRWRITSALVVRWVGRVGAYVQKEDGGMRVQIRDGKAENESFHTVN